MFTCWRSIVSYRPLFKSQKDKALSRHCRRWHLLGKVTIQYNHLSPWSKTSQKKLQEEKRYQVFPPEMVTTYHPWQWLWESNRNYFYQFRSLSVQLGPAGMLSLVKSPMFFLLPGAPKMELWESYSQICWAPEKRVYLSSFPKKFSLPEYLQSCWQKTADCP